MELNKIKILAQRYMDAETSLQEEQQLAEYFASCDDVPDELLPIKAMFNATTQMRSVTAPVNKSINTEKPARRIWLLRLTSVAVAACAIIGIVIGLNTQKNDTITAEPSIICYIDGHYIDNEAIARDKAEHILGGVSNNMQIAMARIEKLNILCIEQQQ